MERERFEELVAQAVESLPQQFKDRLENVAVVVQYWPTGRQLRSVGLRRREDLLGLYEGVPMTAFGRDHSMTPVLPEKISIFQKPIELAYRSDGRILRGIEETVRHEIAHHFGISDRRIQDIARERRGEDNTEGTDGG
jgi:predicted Zn-dependent protease with MMP-like domain